MLADVAPEGEPFKVGGLGGERAGIPRTSGGKRGGCAGKSHLRRRWAPRETRKDVLSKEGEHFGKRSLQQGCLKYSKLHGKLYKSDEGKGGKRKTTRVKSGGQKM